MGHGPEVDPVNWEEANGVRWAYRDRLMIVLVPGPRAFQDSVEMVSHHLNFFRRDAPGASGELILDGNEDWTWEWPEGPAVDFDRLAEESNLASKRIALTVTDDEPLATVGERHFQEQRLLLDWNEAALRVEQR